MNETEILAIMAAIIYSNYRRDSASLGLDDAVVEATQLYHKVETKGLKDLNALGTKSATEER